MPRAFSSVLRCAFSKAATAVLLLALLLDSKASSPAAPAKTAKLISLERIWKRAPNNSFPSLIRFHNRFFCALREGSSQVFPDGAIRILSSPDGQVWRPSALLVGNGDLRRPKLTVTESGAMVLTAELVVFRLPDVEYQTMRWISRDGARWTDSTTVAELNFVMSQPVNHEKGLFAIGASQSPPYSLRLYGGADDSLRKVYLKQLYSADHPAEAALLFMKPAVALSIVHCEAGLQHAMLGVSKSPFRRWQWHDLGQDVADVDMMQAGPQQIIVGGKTIQPKQQTVLSELDIKRGKLQELITLPSGGETGSPSMIMNDGYLWVAYHSSHFQNTSIYLARLKLP